MHPIVRRGFSLFEVLLVLGILGGLSAIAVPAWRDYQVHSDLEIAAEQISQALGRARLRSQSGQLDMPWGFSVSHQTLFGGETYANRSATFDEHYPFPSTIETSGLDEVAFSRLQGMPSMTGSIILTSLRGEQREVHIVIDRQGIAVNATDRLTVCHCKSNPPHTLRLPEAAWPAHSKHGDYLGSCNQVHPEQYCTK